MEQGNQSRYLGTAGEYRVASELLKRGINVALLAVDDGVDLLTVKSNLRIQVKSSKKENYSTRGYTYPVYLFNTRHKKYVNSKNITLRPKIRKEELDYLVCWCVDHDWFYIIPSNEVTQSNINIPIDPTKTSKYEKYKNAWFLLEEGK